MQSNPSPARRRMYALLGVVVVVSLVVVAIGAYRKAFTPVVLVDLQADRAGLLMDPGADVRMRGIPIGEVRSVGPDDGGGARLVLALQPDVVIRVPAGVTAEIKPSTVFGAKYIDFAAPDGAVSVPLRAGDLVRTTAVTTEINDVFLGLQDLLTTVQPSKLNATLGALAQALDGRGDAMGSYLTQLNGYLERFNPSMPTLQADVSRAASVAGTYADAAPDLLAVAEHATTVAHTLSETEAMLHTTLLDFTRTAGNGEEFFHRLEEPLYSAVDALDPTLRLLAEYSPMLTCSIQGLNEERARIEKTMGNTLPGIQGLVTFLPGQEGYQYPRDLPRFARGEGPDCFQLPVVTPDEGTPPRVRFGDGTDDVFRGSTDALTVVPTEPVKVYPDQVEERANGLLAPQQEQGGEGQNSGGASPSDTDGATAPAGGGR